MVAHGTISPEDVGLIRVTDDPEEAAAIVQEGARKLSAELTPIRPSRLMGESAPYTLDATEVAGQRSAGS